MTGTRARRTVIVGGVAAGMSAATRLRRNDESREIIVLERGAHVSFANCGLPYHLGGIIPDRNDLLLQSPEGLHARFRLDVRVRHEVRAIDRVRRAITVRNLDTDETTEMYYDDLVLATGAAPVRPPIPGIDRANVLRDLADLDAIMTAVDTATSAAILGGGFIGLELAENLRRRGIDVTVIELAEQILAPLDPEMAAPVADHLRRHGIGIRTGVGARAIRAGSIVLDDGVTLPADLVVAAIGVRPESTLARAAGLAIGRRGGVVVDDHQRTADPHIFAVGDVAEKIDALDGGPTLIPLANTANRHGRLVADVICGRRVTARPALGTAVVGLFGLTAAVTGSNEKRLRAAGRAYRVIHTHPADHAGYYPGAQSMALKLLVDPVTDAILGAQGVGGHGVDKRIDVIATAMRGGLTATDLADLELAYAPQFGSAKDPVAMLGMIADNLAGGERSVQWHEVERAIDDGTALIDVRSPAEFADGAIPKALNIPLDELRSRADEIPAGPVIVTCAVGQRGHSAARLLGQLGRDVANLDGGYRTWAAGTLG
jgi:NADPH-dependent 2,4-dienoyl-CoA reductase/sulfur reductase-like enzyme/rhodanese-related sulfurtransferase